MTSSLGSGITYQPRKRAKHKLPAGFQPQFGGRGISGRDRKRLHDLARKNTRWAKKFPRATGGVVRRYILSDKPLNYDRYLSESYWLALRAEVLEKRPTCESCGTDRRLQLHHRYYFKAGKSVLYRERQHPDVFMVLCHDCHMAAHSA